MSIKEFAAILQLDMNEKIYIYFSKMKLLVFLLYKKNWIFLWIFLKEF